jgi:hypothetical protein
LVKAQARQSELMISINALPRASCQNNVGDNGRCGAVEVSSHGLVRSTLAVGVTVAIASGESRVQHYYLDLREGEKLVRDAEGQDFTDVAAARDEAIATIHELICDAICEGKLPLHHSIELLDGNRARFLTIQFDEAIEIITS